jgi:hypothetical protein
MHAYMLAYLALLFVALTPGVLLRLPARGSKLIVAAVHGLVFALVWHYTNKLVWRLEGFAGGAPKAPAAAPAIPATPAPATPAPAPAAPAMTTVQSCMKKADCPTGYACMNNVCV